jgi:hypothetical protein
MKTSGYAGIAFMLVGLLVIVVGGWFGLRPLTVALMEQQQIERYVQTVAQVLDVSVQSNHKGIRTLRLSYDYAFSGQSYTGSRVHVLPLLTDDEIDAWHHRLLNAGMDGHQRVVQQGHRACGRPATRPLRAAHCQPRGHCWLSGSPGSPSTRGAAGVPATRFKHRPSSDHLHASAEQSGALRSGPCIRVTAETLPCASRLQPPQTEGFNPHMAKQAARRHPVIYLRWRSSQGRAGMA